MQSNFHLDAYEVDAVTHRDNKTEFSITDGCKMRLSRESLECRNKVLQERILKLEKLNRELSDMHHEAQVKIQLLESENAYLRTLESN